MDSNGTKFVLLSTAEDFATRQADCGWDAEHRAFELARRDTPRLPRLASARALELWKDATPLVLDDQRQLGRLSPDRRRFEYALAWPAAEWRVVRAALDGSLAGSAEELSLDPVDAPAGCAFVDLTLGGSGLAALPWSDGGLKHGLTLVHLRRRWQVNCELPFAPRRAWVDRDDRVWVAGGGELALVLGAPLPQPYRARADRFEPAALNPDPPRLAWTQPLPGNRGVMALAADAARIYVLVLDAAGDDAHPIQTVLARPLTERPDAPFASHALPADLPLLTDIAPLAGDRLLGLAPLEEGPQRRERRDCPVLVLDTDAAGAPRARLLPERWPRRSEAGVRFVRHRDGRVRGLAEDAVLRVHPLAQARFAREAEAVLDHALDCGEPGVVWHRLYIDACVPPGCRLRVAAQAFEVWDAEHGAWEEQPEPLALPIASELPWDQCRGTLHEVLLQRPRGAVRDLAGRYLRLRLSLAGDGRHSPAVYAIRAYWPRFSWQAHYLPGHFHQQETPGGPLAPPGSAANAADLRERLLANFEGLITPIEDRIAASEALLHPEGVPAARLPWLAGLLGTELPSHWPEARQRRLLASLGALQREHGSYRGLVRALDIVTDGAVRAGQVVPVEHFRLRRTLATVLGVDMDDANHPLTLGTGRSGNSRVGDTLILSDEHSKEFLALFAPELARPGVEAQAVERFFDHYARRLTVLLHGPARALRRVVEQALPSLVPAVVSWAVRETDHPFVLGLSPLLQIDTFLEPEPPARPLVLDRSRVAAGDLLRNPVALAPEFKGAVGDEPEGDWA